MRARCEPHIFFPLPFLPFDRRLFLPTAMTNGAPRPFYSCLRGESFAPPGPIKNNALILDQIVGGGALSFLSRRQPKPKQSTMEASSFVQVERFGRIYTGGKVEVTDDGCFIVCVCGEHLKVLDLATGKAVLTIAAEGDDFTAFALHPNRPQLVSAGRSRQLRHWSLQLPHRPSTTTTSASTAATTATATATATASASATASSSASASSSTSALEPSSECIRVWKAHKLPVVELAYERTGTLVASGGADSVVMVFDVPKGFCTHVFRGHSGVVHRLLFHPTRLVLFSSANDNAIRAWDLKTKTCLGVLDAHVSLPSSLALSADGSLLLSGGRDQLVHVWDTDTLELSGSVAVMEALEAIVVEAPSGDARSGDARSEEASDAFSYGLPLTATHLFPHLSHAVWSRAILSRAILFRTCHTAFFVTRHSPPPVRHPPFLSPISGCTRALHELWREGPRSHVGMGSYDAFGQAALDAGVAQGSDERASVADAADALR